MPEKLLAASAMDLKRNDAKGSWNKRGKGAENQTVNLLQCIFAVFFSIFREGIQYSFWTRQ